MNNFDEMAKIVILRAKAATAFSTS